ncbi:MAG: DUF6602 domain-containing protein [Candidatus Helarchaeota archaeon]
MEQTLIQKYSTSLIHSLIEKIQSISSLSHKLSKGELRELFVADILKAFLTSQFDVGSGIIINQKGDQSNQTDIIIYDNRILPPFIKEQHLGIYPAECVLAVIEVKSNLRKTDIFKSEESAKKLLEIIYNPKSSIYKEYDLFKPICSILGFYGNGVKELNDKMKGKNWLNENIKNITFIGLINKFSWIKMKNTGWTAHLVDKTNHETKRFITVLLDNIRTLAERRLKILSERHNDWLGIYIREQNLFN